MPFATPIACGTPRYAADSRSNASTSGPKMKRPDSSASAKRSLSSGMKGAYCALTSIEWDHDRTSVPASQAASGRRRAQTGSSTGCLTATLT